jgi:hypothetical protein
MKLATLALFGAVGVAAAAMGSGAANATPLTGGIAVEAVPDIVQVRGGCGPGWRPTRWGCVRDPHWRPGPRWRSRRWHRPVWDRPYWDRPHW